MLVSPSLAAELAARLTGGRRLAGFGLRGGPAGPVVVSSSPVGGLDGLAFNRPWTMFSAAWTPEGWLPSSAAGEGAMIRRATSDVFSW